MIDVVLPTPETPGMLQLVAFVATMVSVAELPDVTVVGLALIVTVGAGGGAVTVIVADPDTVVYPACVEVAMQ
jgi:hypothetical protein